MKGAVKVNIFRRFFGKQEPQRHEVTPSIHTSVANEIRFLIGSVTGRGNIEWSEGIVINANRDPMEWFRIRPRGYGESGSRYDIPEITGHPTEADPMWPKWIKWIPTSQLDDVRLELSKLARDRCPYGGHLMEEENRRRAVCEFAGHLLFKLFEAEKQARLSTLRESSSEVSE
jgi:hypothetical protein